MLRAKMGKNMNRYGLWMLSLFLVAGPCVVHAKTTVKTVTIKKAPPKRGAKSADVPENYENVLTYAGATKVPVVAKQALLIDFLSGKVLLEKNADQQMAPSSMTKMMTTYLLEEKIQKGEISNETEFLVSEKAWRTQGSKMFVHVGNKVKVADLHRGIAIQSGNDASIVAAEGITGSEEGFAAEMNLMATQLGMTATHFKNAHGLHEDGHYSTARDLAKLATATVKNHQKFYSVNSEKDFTYNGIKQGNRNPLLYDNIGCDGIKTGHTDAGGFGVAASCIDGNQRFILVINGLPSIQARADEARKLIGWAKGNFIGKLVVKKGDVVEKAAKVDTGIKDFIPLVAAQDLYMVMLRSEQDKVTLSPVFDTALVAPVTQGMRAGKLIASLGQSMTEIDIITAESVERLGWFKRMLKYVGL
jgi:serine-type D-Ala-D-Ala carboxypeptidase (penicillin-binding protein 5/6)